MEPLFHRQLQVLPQQGTINVTFVEFDDGVRRGGVGIVSHGGECSIPVTSVAMLVWGPPLMPMSGAGKDG
jgi:hypothetical protein